MGSVLCSGSAFVLTAQEMSVHVEKITAECTFDSPYVHKCVYGHV